MSMQTTSHSPEFQELITRVETALALAAEDARELAERTGTPLIVRDMQKLQNSNHLESKTGSPSSANEAY